MQGSPAFAFVFDMFFVCPFCKPLNIDSFLTHLDPNKFKSGRNVLSREISQDKLKTVNPVIARDLKGVLGW